MASREAEKACRREERLAQERAAAQEVTRRSRMRLIATAVAGAAAVGVVLAIALAGGSGSNGGAQAGGAPTLGSSFGSMAKLPGAQRGGPPWTAGSPELQTRLKAIGLPALSSEGTVLHIHQHLDIYVDGRHVPVPADVGIDPAGGFISPLHTHDTSGIIHVESPTQATFSLGQFFAVWGVPLSATRLGGLASGGGEQLRVWVNGKPMRANPTRIELAPHQEIVIASGTPAQMPKRPAASYAFEAGL